MATVVAIKIVVALDAYNCRIHTDCQSVQKLLTQRNLLRSLSKKENLVLLQLGMVDTEHIDKTGFLDILSAQSQTETYGPSTCGVTTWRMQRLLKI